MNLNYSDYINIETDATEGICSSLVDSQGDISVMKIGAIINDNIVIDKANISNIQGITSEPIKTYGTAQIKIKIQNIIITHTFHIVPNRFAIPTDALIGRDFLNIYNCQLDYANSTFTIRTHLKELIVPMNNGSDYDTTLPPRCEVFRVFKISASFSRNFPYVIPSREISRGVFTATTVAFNHNPIIRVLNTTEKPQRIVTELSNKHTEDICKYNVYVTNKSNENDDRVEKVIEILSPNIPQMFEKELKDLCTEYSDIFTLETDRMTTNNFYTQKLRTTDTTPVFTRNYRLPKTQKDEIDRQISKLLENDLIEPSCSNYNSPIILVPKKGSGIEKRWRMCIDFRKVNQKLIADKFPLPRIDEILDSLGRAKYFTVIDLFSGFHQVPLDEQSRDITSFSTEKGQYRWKVLPFGLNVSPNSFSRMMQIAFSGLPPDHAFLYIDDVIVIGRSEAHHLHNLREVFQMFRQRNLKINPSKCQFFRKEVTFLGHLCTEHGVKPDPNKIDAVRKYPTPKNKDDVRRFVAFANYYRRFIRNFAGIAHFLTKLTRKRVNFKWTAESEAAFQTLKNHLIEPPILTYPDFSKPFIITVDSSDFAAGGVLSQEVDGHDLPISFISKTYTSGEKNKSIVEKELLAIYFAIKAFRPYIYGTTFTVKSDHKPLIYLYKLKEPTSKLLRIRLDLDEYDFEVVYIKGKENVCADALSRISSTDLRNLTETSSQVLVMTRAQKQKHISKEKEEAHETGKICQKISVYETKNECKRNVARIKTKNNKISAYKNRRKLFEVDVTDDFAHKKLNAVSVFKKLKGVTNEKKFVWSLDDEIFNFCSKDEFIKAGNEVLENIEIILMRKQKEIVDKETKLKIMKEFHDHPIFGGHCGYKKMYEKIRAEYYWKQMPRDISKYVSNCEKCLKSKVIPSTKEGMTITPTPIEPFEIVVVDTVGPLTKSINKNVYIVTIMCELSKYLISVPIPDKSANTVAKAVFENLILIHGPIKQLKSDRGTEYKNEIMNELCRMMKIEQRFSTAYHHQTVGVVERNHRNLNEFLRIYLSKDIENWEEYVKYFTYCYNSTTHSSLEDKYTPYELVYGKRNNLPHVFKDNVIDPLYNFENYAKLAKFRLQTAHRNARDILIRMKEKSKKMYDKNMKPLNISVGEECLIMNEPYDKHKQIYNGPYVIVEILHPNVKIKDKETQKEKIVHKDKIRKINHFKICFFRI